MRIQIIWVGQKMPAWVDSACSDYLKRLPREIKVEFTRIAMAQRKTAKSLGQLKQQEATAILKKTTGASLNIALDERGDHWTSQEWASQLKHWMREHPQVNLIIGGPDGLAAECRDACAQSVALGAMTMPHTLVRVVLVEQIYRAWSLLKGHPYHRE